MLLRPSHLFWNNVRRAYSGTTCDEVAREWGTQLDERVISVIEGPAAARGQGRSSRLYDAEVLAIQLANKHLRDNGLTPSCDVDRFLSQGESEFSSQTATGVGLIMYEGDPVASYDEWLERQLEFVALIMMEPDTPYAP